MAVAKSFRGPVNIQYSYNKVYFYVNGYQKPSNIMFCFKYTFQNSVYRVDAVTTINFLFIVWDVFLNFLYLYNITTYYLLVTYEEYILK